MTVTRDMEMQDAALLEAFSALFTPQEPAQLERALTMHIPQISFDEDLDLRVIVQAVLANDDAAVVRVEAGYYDSSDNMIHTWQVEGSAKRDPEDEPNRETGIALATARAFQALANQFTRQAEGRVENADKMYIQRREQRIRNQQWRDEQRKAAEKRAAKRKAVRAAKAEEEAMIASNTNTNGQAPASKPVKKIKKKVNAK